MLQISSWVIKAKRGKKNKLKKKEKKKISLELLPTKMGASAKLSKADPATMG